MNGKQILLETLKRNKTERTPWVPFVGVHGANLIGAKADDYLNSADLMVEGLTKARDLYNPDGLPICFDLQIEAEVLGCDLHWADAVPPSVTTHPLAQGKTIADLPKLDETKGRFPVVTEVLDRLKTEMGDEVALYGLICGPFTLALHLRGNDIFLDMFDEEEEVEALVMYCAEVAKNAADIYMDHGADVIAVVDPMTSQISPAHFEQFVAPAMNTLFDHINNRGAISSIFVCGDVTRNLDVMCKTTAQNISVDEQIDMKRMRELSEKYNKSFGGNLTLTTVLLMGDEHDAEKNTIQVMDASGDVGFVLSPGCDLPFDVPQANLEAVSRMVHDEYQRNVARTTQRAKEEDTFDDIEVPDYAAAEDVIVDVITLDSESCAPCTYMTDAAKKGAASALCSTQVTEHKITTREGLGMMTKLGVKNIPTICINGIPTFESLIPDQPTLIAAIENAAK